MGYGPQWGMMGNWGYGFGFGLLHTVVSVAVIFAVIVALIWLMRSLTGGAHGPGSHRRSPGLDVLEERYAKGEINRDEYLQKKRDMTG